MLDEAGIIRLLNKAFANGEWPTVRMFPGDKKGRDPESFSSANIIGILDRCSIHDRQLLANIDRAKEKQKEYQRDHLTYFWPFSRGYSIVPDAPFLSRLTAAALSPDADCTCLSQIVQRDRAMADKVTEELVFYRNDGKRFQLPKFQRGLPSAENTFLTWFPPRERCRNRKPETIDLGVDANILWFLGSFGLLSIPGARETIRFIRDVLSTDLIFTDTFKVAMFYQHPPLILYLVSRAVHWGKIEALYSMRKRILQLAGQIRPSNMWDRLLLASIGLYWESPQCVQLHIEALEKTVPEPALFCTAPCLGWLVLRKPIFEALARKPWASVKFESQALHLALLLWFRQELRRETVRKS